MNRRFGIKKLALFTLMIAVPWSWFSRHHHAAARLNDQIELLSADKLVRRQNNAGFADDRSRLSTATACYNAVCRCLGMPAVVAIDELHVDRDDVMAVTPSERSTDAETKFASVIRSGGVRQIVVHRGDAEPATLDSPDRLPTRFLASSASDLLRTISQTTSIESVDLDLRGIEIPNHVWKQFLPAKRLSHLAIAVDYPASELFAAIGEQERLQSVRLRFEGGTKPNHQKTTRRTGAEGFADLDWSSLETLILQSPDVGTFVKLIDQADLISLRRLHIKWTGDPLSRSMTQANSREIMFTQIDKRLPNLTSLTLDGFGDLPAQQWHDIGRMRQLQSISFLSTWVDAETLAAIDTLPRLRRIAISGQRIDRSCINTMRRFKHLDALEVYSDRLPVDLLQPIDRQCRLQSLSLFADNIEQLPLASFTADHPTCRVHAGKLPIGGGGNGMVVR